MSDLEPVVLSAGAFTLRPPTPTDAAQALAMLADPDVRQWFPGPSQLDLDTVRDWCVRAADWSAGTHAVWTVADTQGGLVGSAVLVAIDRDQLTAWVGYRTAPWARRRGVATRAVEAVSGFAFDVLGLERLELHHTVANPFSCGVADRTGFALEGVLRAAYRDDNGRRWDTHLHSRLSSPAVIRT